MQRENREHQRHTIPVMVTCRFVEEILEGKVSFQAFIQDISFGGVSLQIRDDYSTIKESLLLNTAVKMTVEFNFPDGIHTMYFSGVIRWFKKHRKEDKNFLSLGVKFKELNERSKYIIKNYLSSGNGDRNLIWNLWDNVPM